MMIDKTFQYVYIRVTLHIELYSYTSINSFMCIYTHIPIYTHVYVCVFKANLLQNMGGWVAVGVPVCLSVQQPTLAGCGASQSTHVPGHGKPLLTRFKPHHHRDARPSAPCWRLMTPHGPSASQNELRVWMGVKSTQGSPVTSPAARGNGVRPPQHSRERPRVPRAGALTLSIPRGTRTKGGVGGVGVSHHSCPQLCLCPMGAGGLSHCRITALAYSPPGFSPLCEELQPAQGTWCQGAHWGWSRPHPRPHFQERLRAGRATLLPVKITIKQAQPLSPKRSNKADSNSHQ